MRLLTTFHNIWSRLGGFHGMLGIGIYRFGNFVYYKLHIPVIRQILWVFYRIIDMLFVRMLLSAGIPGQCKIGKRLYLPHGVAGIFIHDNTVIGDNVTIFHQVTIGKSDPTSKYLSPVIENGVFIGAGAKILGGIIIGVSAKIGANAVVLINVPPHSTAVGVPARIIESKTGVGRRKI